MKVLQVVPDLKSGGGEWVAVSLHRWMKTAGVDCRIVSLLGDVNESAKPRTQRANFVEGYAQSWYRLFRRCRRMKREGWQPDIIHAHMYPAQLLAAALLRRLWPNAVLSTTEHSTSNRRRSLPCGRQLDSRLFRHFYSIACISQATHDSLKDWLPELATRMTVIRNGVDLSPFAGTPSRTGRTPAVVISVGRLEVVKNYATALAAVSLMKDAAVEYWIVGDGSEASKLPVLAANLGIARQVHFLGWRDDVPDLLQQADIMFMPSLWEGFGLALAQGMASGLPVVASDIPASRELLGASNSGYLCAPLDTPGFADALRLLMGDCRLRLALGEEARRRATHFDFEKTANGYFHLFMNLARRSTPLLRTAAPLLPTGSNSEKQVQ
jgi:glycosyltransferase involved in cell wall biosynthesis